MLKDFFRRMNEKRPRKRYKVDLLDINNAVIQASDAEIINISLRGISLRANRRLNMSETYILRIKSKGTVLNLKGIVIWSQISKILKGPFSNIIPVYTAGLEFLDSSNNKREVIRNFIETHEKEDYLVDTQQLNNMRLYMRAQVNAPEKALILDQRENHKVKQLGFSGAKIESKHPMKVNDSVPMIISFTEDKFIVFQGRIVSCLLIRTAYPKAYDVEIQFTKLSENDKEILVEFIRLLDATDKNPKIGEIL
jgi:hypothetical protein